MRLRTLVREGATAVISTTIRDLEGAALGSADLDTLTLTLWDEATQGIINDRDDQDVLNTNGGTLDADGAFELRLDPDDTVVVNDFLRLEWHEAILTWTWQTGSPAVTYTGKASIKYRVVNEDPTTLAILTGGGVHTIGYRCGCIG